MEDRNDKNIDESWKEAVEKEKGKNGPGNQDKTVPDSDADFSLFITTLALQVSINLGHVPNPMTEKKEENLPQAKFLIDTLGILEEKTKGNLNAEESGLLENLLYELRMQYAAKIKGGEK